MSEITFAKQSEVLREAVLNVLWRQWAAIGAAANAEPARAAVDPEALILMSLSLLEHEPRLRDLLGSWATRNSTILSIQRIKNLTNSYPKHTRINLQQFARMVHDDGKDFRWRTLFTKSTTSLSYRNTKQLSVGVPSKNHSAIILRLRQLLGVGIRADALGFMLCSGIEATTHDIAEATSYTPAAVKRVLDDLTNSGFVIVSGDGRTTRYSVDRKLWKPLLDTPPAWRYWSGFFAFAAAWLAAAEERQKRTVSDFAAQVLIQEIANQHASTVNKAKLIGYKSTDETLVVSDILKKTIEWLEEPV